METTCCQADESGRELSLRTQLLYQCRAMAQYALASGLKVPGSIVDILEANTGTTGGAENPLYSVQQLALIHGQLADIVAPSKPRTILLLACQQTGFSKFLGPVPLIRQMLGIAIFSLLLFFGISLSSRVNGDSASFSLTQNDGISLLLNQLFLLSAASIGASFFALSLASRYVRERTYDPILETTYWIKYFLGLLSGVIVADLLPGAEELGGYGAPLLALLGGFSADVVYRILHRMTVTLESLIQGDRSETIVTREEAAKTRYKEQTLKDSMRLSANIVKLQQKLNSGSDQKEIAKELERLQAELILPGSDNRAAIDLITNKPENKPACGRDMIGEDQNSKIHKGHP